MANYSKNGAMPAPIGKQNQRPANDDSGPVIRPFRGSTTDPGNQNQPFVAPFKITNFDPGAITWGTKFKWLLALSRDCAGGKRLSSIEIAVAGVIIDRTHPGSGLAWPTSRETIARLAGCHLKSVQAAVQTLRARGWIEVETGGVDAGGNRYTNRYRPIFPAMLPND